MQKPEFDFEVLYRPFPRKEGKTKGMQKLVKTVKNADVYARLAHATANYIDLVKFEKREKQYIKHWATFCNCWQDYEDREALGLPSISLSAQSTFKPVQIKR